MKITDLG